MFQPRHQMGHPAQLMVGMQGLGSTAGDTPTPHTTPSPDSDVLLSPVPAL